MFVAEPSATSAPIAMIRSLEPGDKMHRKIIRLERDPDAAIKKLFEQHRKKELEEEGVTLGDNEEPYDDFEPRPFPYRTAYAYDEYEPVKKRVRKTGGMTAKLKMALDEIARQETKAKQVRISLPRHQVMERVIDSNPKVQLAEWICGPRGAGKSHMAGQLARDYARHHPDNDIYLFSQCDTDENLDDLKNLKRVPLTEDLVEQPLECKNLHDSLCIFDDIDNVSDKAVSKVVHNLRDLCLDVGRKSRISVISTTHMLYGGSAKTSAAKRESSAVTVFPGSGEVGALRNYLRTAQGMSKAKIEELLKLDSRWVTVLSSFPKTILSERKAYIL